MNKQLAKEEIKKLIAKYEQVKSSGKINSYTEEETKNAFITPLFKALGWNFEEKEEVSAEEHEISSGRVDYGFYINDRPKFYLEAKSLKANLNMEDFAKQAIRYSFNRGVTWAVLTDFEAIKVFNAQSPSQYLGDKLYFEIKYPDYLDRFDQLWLLSKESMREDLIDKEAERVGKKLQRVPVTEQLYKDLEECRKLLISYLGQWNPERSKDDLDEGVQKLLDRLIFIRVAEDRKIEQNILIPLLNQWRSLTVNNKPRLYQSMAKKFRELDEIYNSNLFTPHPFEDWEDDGGGLEKVIKILHGKQGYYEYDFSVMPADILGSVYENYLGYKLSQSKKGLTLDKSASKRKEQGIYYTPTFIVDYIVKNALKPVLDNCKSVNDLKKIKVLDPACGSGSFLLKVMEVINDKYKEFGYAGDELTKVQILQENIYGVDLDQQAVEIARLNLLINALEQKGKLPSLDKNIKNGNSLISGTDEEMEKYFGKNFRDKNPFNWKEKFPEVFEQGGFDVIVGNPPWVFTKEGDFSDSEKQYFGFFVEKLGLIQAEKGRNIQSGKLNLYSLFILKATALLKDKGTLGFVIPNNILRATNFDLVRKYILDKTKILEIVDLGEGIFQGVTASSIILFLQKEIKNKLNNIKIISNVIDLNERKFSEQQILQEQFLSNSSFTFNILSSSNLNILSKKIVENSLLLGSICQYISPGIDGDKEKYVSDTKTNEFYKPLLFGKNFSRYNISYNNKWIYYDRKKLNRARAEEIYLSEKIVLQRISGGDKPLTATIDNNKYYTFNSVNNIILNQDSGYSLKYILGIINSALMNWYYSINFSNRSKLTVNISKTYLEQLPIKKTNNQKNISSLVDKILKLNEESRTYKKDSNKWNSIKEEIERTDKKIDQEVYKLYDLTSEEIKIVEGDEN
ncbi:MAG: hypothetical protein CO135_03790 [Candidatus Levybacteria bacterium CG_4_9_14_3_um_filter_35_16]|nr:MAG: hypothetical protein COW87_03155 [Candidatus Levybacteria bacterium CG22_combo_CG10-13_8_21_14_all_35_11]PJA90927.1 MAG: hypothetical protein CO135_03790 [Candidatus Levybacteria bacterium CG_4_9_14_3_um_filter_35_16]PJC54705.1 MAG: hypothetical protein CO028_01065 [Candidatus Levybacteria bacterium CG_4_9_14_0_2_um_filter_35_21]